MTYEDTVNWMFNQLPMYQNQGKTAYKKDLSNTILLANYLNNPEDNFRSVHVAGTNGKGSTSHMIASVMQEAGYRVGLYTSPHLKDFRERIKINGQEISKQFVIGFIKKHKSFFEQNALSFFEMTVGMAFDYFTRKKVDIAIIEVGLGGRLDSTNIITPEVSVITNIGLDHTQFLGNTLEAIAKEKAGIIKDGVPVVIGETQSKTKEIFETLSSEKNAPIVFADQLIKKTYTSDLTGSYQRHNIKTAAAVFKQLNLSEFQLNEDIIKKGLDNVVNNTGLKGRWQILQEAPKVICDTAHNREGLSYIVKQLEAEDYENLHVVFGVVSDKELNSVLSILPKNAQYYLCKPNVQRGMNVENLKKAFDEYDLNNIVLESVSEAFKKAKNNATNDDLIYVGGSTFVVAEIL